MDVSDAEIVGFIDGDLQYPPNAIPEMYKKLLEQKAGVIIANRKTYKSRSKLRLFGSKANVLIFGKLLLGLDYDIQSGLKLFRKDIAKHIYKPLVTPWTFDIPLLYAAKELNQKIIHHNINFESRNGGSSKVSFIKTALAISVCAIKTRFKHKEVYRLDENDTSRGIIYKRKHYVTHSNLPQHKSAIRTLILPQKILLYMFIGAFIAGVLDNALLTFQMLIAVLSTIYFSDVIFSSYVVLKSLHFPPELKFSKAQIKSINTSKLPIYTILCPLYKEWNILPQFVENINKIDWPKNKLEVLLLLEEDDEKTIETAKKMNLPSHFKIIPVPHSMPKTKPKACNYGLNIATGEYVVIYDAEDQPDTDQLKKAFIAFSKVDKKTICIRCPCL